MSVVKELIQSIRKRKTETAIDVFGPYRKLLIDLATGETVDAGEAETVIEQAGKTETQLASDVETMRQRMAAADTIALATNGETAISIATENVSKLQTEFGQVCVQYRSRIESAKTELASAELVVKNSNWAKSTLETTVLEPNITSSILPIQSQST